MKINIHKLKKETLKRVFLDIPQTVFLGIPLFFIVISGCKKFVQVDPPKTDITRATVYTTDLSAAAAVTGIYSNMSNGALSQGSESISCLGGLLADELNNYSTDPTESQCYMNSLTSANPYFWSELYQEIHSANAVIEGLSVSNGVTIREKQQLIGEAEFMRAFLHFYATNIFGDIPLVTTTNYLVNNTIHRSPQADVYHQIITDLKDAQGNLSVDFVTPTGGVVTTERVRPNKGAANALLARVYLYTGDWADAEVQATAVIQNTTNYSLAPNLDSVFLMNSMEAIWQMQPVYPGDNTIDADTFILFAPPATGGFPVALNSNLINTFENGDKRFAHWVGAFSTGTQTYYYPYKYKVSNYQNTNPVTEYLMVLRLSEQYLIRAEARAQQSNLAGAAADLNMIRNRAGLPNSTATTQSDLLNAIYHERRVELFSEWGHRWFDLKRIGTINAVMSVIAPQKGGTWSPNSALFPIPQSEITINANLTQNPGY